MLLSRRREAAHTNYTTVQVPISVYAVGSLSITGFSPGSPVAGQALPSQTLNVFDVNGNAFSVPQGSSITVSIQDDSTGTSFVLVGQVAVNGNQLTLNNMTIPAGIKKNATCQLVITIDGLSWTSNDFNVAA